MSYHQLEPVYEGLSLTSRNTNGRSPWGVRHLFTRNEHRSSVDDLPLLNLSTEGHDNKPRRSDSPRSSHTSTYDVLLAQQRHLAAADKGKSSFEFSERLKSRLVAAARYVRASGPAKTSPSKMASKHSHMPTGWRLGTWVCCAAVVLCVIVEVCMLIYAFRKSRGNDDAEILLEGNCEQVRTLELWLLLPLNIVGTTLIGTSNYMMQVVAAPERKDIDEAHSFGRSIALGGIHFKNMWFKKGKNARCLIWWALGVSSLPIHLLLNAAVFSSVQASNTGVLVVSEDFVNDSDWDFCGETGSSSTPSQDVACSLIRNYTSGHTLHMTTSQCLRQYSSGFQTNASSVIVVTTDEVVPWYNIPLSVELSDASQYSIWCQTMNISDTFCGRHYTEKPATYPCEEIYTSIYSDDTAYVEISNATLAFAYYPETDTTVVSPGPGFTPYCVNTTASDSNNDTYWELDSSSASDIGIFTTTKGLSLREDDPLSNISSIKALFSAFEYRFWATAAINQGYLQDEVKALINNKDPRYWICPRDHLVSNTQCDPTQVQREDEWKITPESMVVQACHVLPKQERCVLRYSAAILIINVCFDIVKLVAMIAALRLVSEPLTTLGDIIESFLRRPDQHTLQIPVLDDSWVEDWLKSTRQAVYNSGFDNLRMRYGPGPFIGKKCPYCKSLIWPTDSPGDMAAMVRLFMSHNHCGPSHDHTGHAPIMIQQSRGWAYEGGIWWTTVAPTSHQWDINRLRSRRWLKVPSLQRWKWFRNLYIPAFMFAAVYFGINFRTVMDQRPVDPWIVGFRAPDPNSLLVSGLSGTRSIFAAAVLINAPQLFFSALYFIFNTLLTLMHTAQEWASFAVKRKALRVSSPRGQQRATYWLQLPWAYSIPLTALSGLMHWLLSRSLYIVKVDSFGYLGEREEEDDYFACGFSPIPALLLLILLVMMCCSILALSLRRLPAGIPFVRLNSLALAAACHANPAEQDVHLKPLQWGIVEGYEPHDAPHCSFSSLPVTALCDGAFAVGSNTSFVQNKKDPNVHVESRNFTDWA